MVDNLTETQKQEKEVESEVIKYLIVFGLIAGCIATIGISLNLIFGIGWWFHTIDASTAQLTTTGAITIFLPAITYSCVGFHYGLKITLKQVYKHHIKAKLTTLKNDQLPTVEELKRQFFHASPSTNIIKSFENDPIATLHHLLEKLPKFIQKIVKFILGQVPIFQLFLSIIDEIKSYDGTQKSFIKEMDKTVNELLDNTIPTWVEFIIPVNLILLTSLLFI